MITTTLFRIREHSPCRDSWEKLLAGLGKTKADDDALPFADIVRICGIEDALWACRAEPQHAREWRLFAVWCARQVQHLMKDDRSVHALDVAERHARGEADDAELAAAWDAAWAAARDAARSAAWDAAWAAARDAARSAARDAAWAAARDAARSAARDAAWAAVWTAAMDAVWTAAMDAAWAAAWAAARASARDAARDAARAAQTAEFLRVVGDCK